GSPIEQNYYSCRIKDIDLCYWCGVEDDIIEPSEDLKSKFKTIYPLCISYEANGCEWSTRASIVFRARRNFVFNVYFKPYMSKFICFKVKKQIRISILNK
ncbi:9685_t:CDS:1, partial [Gigaspora margarita]